MRLLNAHTLKFEEFPNKPPPYAILSHTWGDEEVSLQELQQHIDKGPIAKFRNSKTWKKSGYTKIVKCAERARSNMLDYFWVDTCCIDKCSSAELQEAINSMFRWYRGSKICYAYLSDVPGRVFKQDSALQRAQIATHGHVDGTCSPQVHRQGWEGLDGTTKIHLLEKSRWFTRGWTLQELLAPLELEFLDQDWTMIGTKLDLDTLVEGITGIERIYIRGSEGLETASVAKRMSWAAKRETTREEDMAYCLLGIFDINMPLLYGEGNRAFIRLQEEIMKVSDDASLLAWGYTGRLDVGTMPQPVVIGSNLWLATHPAQFTFCGDVEPFSSWIFPTTSFHTNQHGMQISLLIVSDPNHASLKYGILSCGVRTTKAGLYVVEFFGTPDYFIAIPLLSSKASLEVSSNDGNYLRHHWLVPIAVPATFIASAVPSTIRLPRAPQGFLVRPLGIELSQKVTNAYIITTVYPPQPKAEKVFSIKPDRAGDGGEHGGRLIVLRHLKTGAGALIYFRCQTRPIRPSSDSPAQHTFRVARLDSELTMEYLQRLLYSELAWDALLEGALEDEYGRFIKGSDVFRVYDTDFESVSLSDDLQEAPEGGRAVQDLERHFSYEPPGLSQTV